MTPEFRRALAELLSGLSVPRSLGILGEAQDPWDKIINELGLFGYFTAEKAEAALERYLDDPAPVDPGYLM